MAYSTHSDTDTIAVKLVSFMSRGIIPNDLVKGFSAVTPILELGVLDSLNAARLINYIRDEMGVIVPHTEISTDNFKDVRSIAAMVHQLAAAAKRTVINPQ